MFEQWGKFSRKHLYSVLGVDRRLPARGISRRELDHGYGVYLKPQGEQPIGAFSGRPRKRNAHRITVICLCGRHVPSGRMEQHLKACSGPQLCEWCGEPGGDAPDTRIYLTLCSPFDGDLSLVHERCGNELARSLVL